MPSDLNSFVRDAYESWNAGDLERFVSFAAPDIDLRTSGAFPDLPPQYRGHEGVRQFWHDVREPWEELRIDVEGVDQAGELVLVAFRFRARGREGLEADARFFQVADVTGGLVGRIEAFFEESAARTAFETWKAGRRAA